jgi:hypothetical protein
LNLGAFNACKALRRSVIEAEGTTENTEDTEGRRQPSPHSNAFRIFRVFRGEISMEPASPEVSR